MEEKNAIITSATITNDDHGLLSAWLFLEHSNGNQGFGGYALYLPKSFTNHEHQSNFAGHFIWRVLEIAGVDAWEKLTGKTIRIHSEPFESIQEIGHIVHDDWFNPHKDFEAMLQESNNATPF